MVGQAVDHFDRGKIELSETNMPFRILKPKDLDPAKEYPLILFLHGSGERGTDNQLQLKHGGSFFASDSIREKYPAFVVFPQCPPGKNWHTGNYIMGPSFRLYTFPKEKKENQQLKMVEYILRSLQEKYKIDQNRIYLGGLSNGAMGTYELVRRNPDRFAAAVAICGGANPAIADRLKSPSWWIFHGDMDNVVSFELSVNMFYAIRALNPDVKLTIYEGVKHDSWTNAFAEPGLMEWLFSKQKD